MKKKPICSNCNEILENYNGIGRPKKYCDECRDENKVVLLNTEQNITFNSMAEAIEYAGKSNENKSNYKKCILCQKKLKGQRRKFCSDYCRKTEFYNRTKVENKKPKLRTPTVSEIFSSTSKNQPSTIEFHNKILRKNYDIILDIFDYPTYSYQKVLKSKMIDKGYNFNYFTHYIKTEKKGFFFNKEILSTCLYEFTIELKSDFVVLIKRTEN
jgi:hypothetical protein